MAEPRVPWPGAEPGRSIRGLLDVLARRLAATTGGGVDASVWVRHREVDRPLVATSDVARRSDVAGSPVAEDVSGGAAGSAVPAGPPVPAGPVGAVLAGGADVLLPDLTAAGDWPAWRRAVRGEGFRGAAVVRADVARGGALALALYLTTPGAVDAEVGRRLTRLARQAASLVALHSTIPARRPLVRAPSSPARPRVGVQSAVGALMEARGCGEDEARRVLTVLAAEQGRTLEAVAASVLEHAGRSARPGPPHRRV